MVDRSQRGKPLPAFTLSDPAGKTLVLPEQTGKPLLINLWATWCAPCVAELPTLEALAAKGQVRVLTVSQDMSDPAKVTQFLAERGGPSLEPWLDPENDLSFHYGSGTLPTTIYYDAQGREVWRFVGEQDWAGEDAAKLLAETAGYPPSPSSLLPQSLGPGRTRERKPWPASRFAPPPARLARKPCLPGLPIRST